jgi:hypothetical protein
MDRKPKPAPFPVGTKLRYIGGSSGDPCVRSWVEVGDVLEVVRTRPGRQGTLRWIDLDDGDEPFQDTTRDGYSVVEPKPGFGRIVQPDEWEIVQ